MIASDRPGPASPKLLALVLLALVSWGCTYSVLGQRIAAHRFAAKEDDFDVEPDEDVAVLHYYGVGGWGILWKGSYLLTAPYFSNHDILASSICAATPDRDAIKEGFDLTPYDKTTVILVGHGHVDHASDIPAYPFDKMHRKPTLIADPSTIRLLGDETRADVCPIEITPDGGMKPFSGSESCPTGNFRIRPIPWAHAPQLGARRAGIYLTFGNPQGSQATPLGEPPLHGNDWLIGRTWAYLIELLDKGKPVFRIHYVDAAANPGIAGPQLTSDEATDVHIGCVPGFDYVGGYPTGVIRQYHVKYVLAGHWEDFFQDRDCRLKPVHAALNDRKMGEFVTEAQKAIDDLGARDPKAAPDNKTAKECPNPGDCGPHGTSWTVPIPGETFRFEIGR